MASAVKLEGLTLNHRGFNELLRSQEVRAVLQDIVDDIEATAGDGYLGDVIQGRTRARGGVVTATPEAMVDNARHNTLVRAFSGARRA